MEHIVSPDAKGYMLKTSFMQFRNYVYIGMDRKTRNAFVVDPAWEMKKIEGLLEREHLKLDKILLTHSHLDHINLANQLAEKYDALVFMSEEEIKYYHFDAPNLIGFSDMETIPIGQQRIRCILTPGHTKGGACYWFGNHLYTGDTVFMEGCGICKTPGGSASEMYHSIQKLKALITDETKIYPGHSYGSELGKEFGYVNAHNIYFQIETEDAFVKFRNRSNIKGIFNFK